MLSGVMPKRPFKSWCLNLSKRSYTLSLPWWKEGVDECFWRLPLPSSSQCQFLYLIHCSFVDTLLKTKRINYFMACEISCLVMPVFTASPWRSSGWNHLSHNSNTQEQIPNGVGWLLGIVISLSCCSLAFVASPLSEVPCSYRRRGLPGSLKSIHAGCSNQLLAQFIEQFPL